MYCGSGGSGGCDTAHHIIEVQGMNLIIGGYAQGKLDYAVQKYKIKTENIHDGKLPDAMEEKRGDMVINHLHIWIRERLLNGKDPLGEILGFLEKNPDCMLISDEVGNGIVPMEAFEREYRERVGRILVELAKRADKVERVICGLGQKIK